MGGGRGEGCTGGRGKGGGGGGGEGLEVGVVRLGFLNCRGWWSREVDVNLVSFKVLACKPSRTNSPTPPLETGR